MNGIPATNGSNRRSFWKKNNLLTINVDVWDSPVVTYKPYEHYTLASFKNDKEEEHIPIVDPQNNQLEEQEAIRQSSTQTVDQIRQFVGVEVIEDVSILEDQSRPHHWRPEQLEQDRRIRPDSGEMEADFHRWADGAGWYHRVKLRFRSLDERTGRESPDASGRRERRTLTGG